MIYYNIRLGRLDDHVVSLKIGRTTVLSLRESSLRKGRDPQRLNVIHYIYIYIHTERERERERERENNKHPHNDIICVNLIRCN